MAKRIYQNRSGRGKPTKQTNSPWDRVIKYISYKARTEKEVRDYLGEDCSEEIIAKLKDYKFIDDAEYAKMFAAQRERFRPRSRKMLEFELKKKGILSTTHLVLSTDSQLAYLALERKMRLWQKLTYLEFKTKAARFLASRGFSWDIIEKAVKKAYNEAHVN
jgi:regulatory protein